MTVICKASQMDFGMLIEHDYVVIQLKIQTSLTRMPNYSYIIICRVRMFKHYVCSTNKLVTYCYVSVTYM